MRSFNEPLALDARTGDARIAGRGAGRDGVASTVGPGGVAH